MNDTRERTETAQAQMDDGSNTGKELAPVRQQRLTVAQEREQGRAKLIQAVESRQAEISAFLKPFNVSWDFFLSCLRVAMMKTLKDDGEFFVVVTPTSFLEAVLRCAMNGHLPDGKEAAIARFKEVATYMPMRDGFVKTMHRTGMIRDINDGLVTAREEALDRFDYEEGSSGFIKHRPMMDRDEKTDVVVAAYCIVHTINGGEYREVVPKSELAKIAAVSRATKGPRVDWAWRMHQKAPLRRIILKLPKDEALSRLLAHDDMNYDLTLNVTPERESIIPKSALFGHKAHVKAKPEPEGPAAPAQEPQDGQVEDGAAQEPESNPEALRLVTAMLHCESVPDLIDLIAEGEALVCSEQEHAWLAETSEATRVRLMPSLDEVLDGDAVPTDAEFADPPGPSSDAESGDEGASKASEPVTEASSVGSGATPLMAVLSSSGAITSYEDAGAWATDILARLSAYKGDKIVAFWAANLGHVLAARDHFPAKAENLLKVAQTKNLKTEMAT